MMCRVRGRRGWRHHPSVHVLWSLFLLLFTSAWTQAAIIDEKAPDLHEAYGKLPLYFIENQGQLDKAVRYFEKGRGHDTFFTRDGVYLRLARPDSDESNGQALLKLGFIGANPSPQIEPLDLQPGKVNYFIGGDPRNWKTEIPTFGALLYQDVYPGIDIRFYGNNRQLVYDVIVAPGADPNKVRLNYTGIRHLGTNARGELVIDVGNGQLYQSRPYVYQDIDGQRIEVAGRFRIDDPDAFTYGFELGSYDRNHPLVIDPVIDYSTYLGGSGTDTAYGVAVDSSGNAYITGETNSTAVDFPVVGGISLDNAGAKDVFITKFDPTGGTLIYSTFFGGANDDIARAIAVDSAGNVFITGSTTSDSLSFPTTASAYQGTLGGGAVGDAFVARINAQGSSLDYSSYLGGGGGEIAYAIAVDDVGAAYVAGKTDSADFPTVAPYQGAVSGVTDGFVARFDTTQSGAASLVYSTYLGGAGDDAAYGIAIDAAGNAYVTGETTSLDYPLSTSPLNGVNAGGVTDAFVTELNPTGNGLVFSTYLGGGGTDRGHGIAVDGSGVYVTGETSSTDFPTAAPINTANAGLVDVFVTKLNSTASAYVYSTYLGGAGTDAAYALAVDGAGNVYVTGQTDSSDFPTVVPLFATLQGGVDAFTSKINAAGSSVDFSTYLGGDGSDIAYGIAVDAQESAYVAGQTGPITSIAFPTVNPYDNTLAGTDAFVTKMTTTSADLSVTKVVDNGTPIEGDTIVYTITVTNIGPSDATTVSVADQLPAGVTYASDDGAGAYNSGTGVWTIGALANGASTTLNITATVDAGTAGTTITNTATVSLTETDPNGANDSASVDVTVSASADLAMTKAVDNATPLEGDTIVYTLTVSNNGPNDATGVSVNDTLPAGVTYVSDDSAGAYAGGVWTIGNLLNAATATLNITVTVDAGTVGTTINNTATVSGAEIDPAAANDSATASITVGATADLAVAKIVDNASPNEGDSIVYTITVTNNGPNDATTVSVADALPAGVTYASDTPSVGTYDNVAGAWSIGTLANGASATLTITATVNAGTAGTTITNTATASTADTDPTPGNDTASAALTVLAADLGITKTVDNAAPIEGGTIIYTVTITNNGPNDASNVTLTDLLPAGVTYVADTPSVGAYNSGTGEWIIGTMLNAATETLTITATVDSGTTGQLITNTATATATEGDPNTLNDIGAVDITVGVAADLGVVKTVDNPGPAENGLIVYTITVDNSGPNDATGVVVSDLLPVGVTYVSDDGGGAYDSLSGAWTIGSLLNTATATLNITASVDTGTAGTTITNTATATATEGDPNNLNDSGSVAIVVNTPPVANPDAAAITEDALPDTVSGDMRANDSDLEDPLTSLTVIDVGGDTTGTVVGLYGTLTWASDGTFTYQLDNTNTAVQALAVGQTLNDVFTYIIGDSDGDTGTSTLTVTISGANDPPVAVDDVATTDENTAVTTGDVLLNDTDIDGDVLSVAGADTLSVNGGSVLNNGNGTFTYTPAAAFSGTDTFTYTVSDGNGGTAVGTVTITVIAADNPPVADPQSVTTAEEAPLAITLTGSDPEGLPVTYSLATQPLNGVLSGAAPNVTYTPNLDFNGTDSFTFIVNDGVFDSTPATITITVTPVNDPPVAVDDTATVAEDGTVTTANVLLNDTDVEGDILTVTGVTTSVFGATVIDNGDGTFTFTPRPDFFGTDWFDYIISDGNGGSGQGTVAVTVTPSNDPPTAVADGAVTDRDVPVTTGNVLNNDIDVDGDSLTITGADTVSANGGTVVNNGNGTFTYTPPPLFNGTDTFTYTVSDGNGASSQGTVSIVVNIADSFTQVGVNVQVTPGLGVKMTFDNVTVSGSSTAAVISTVPAPPPGFSFGTQTEFLNISTTAVFTGNVEVCVPYDETLFSSERSLVLLHWNTTAIGWESLTSTLDTDNNTVCGITSSLSPFAVAQESSTAITLRDFSAIHRERQVDLSWVTSSEINNEGFFLLRSDSPDGPFAPITPSMIPARGGPGLTMTYTFTDFNVQPGRDYYYRLQDVDSRGMRSNYDVLARAPGSNAEDIQTAASSPGRNTLVKPDWQPNTAGSGSSLRLLAAGNVTLLKPAAGDRDELAGTAGARDGHQRQVMAAAGAGSSVIPSRQAAADGQRRFQVRHTSAPAALYDGAAIRTQNNGLRYSMASGAGEHPSNAFSVSITDGKGNVVQVDRVKARDNEILRLTALQIVEEAGRKVVTWQVSDLRVRGFMLHRSERGKDRYTTVVNFVPNYGQDDGGRYLYRFSDNTAQAGKAYDYRLEVKEWGASAAPSKSLGSSDVTRQETGSADSGDLEAAA